MFSAPGDLYGTFSDSDISFADAVDPAGVAHPLRLVNFVSIV